MRAEVESRHGKAWIVVLDECQEPAGAAGDVEQPRLADAPGPEVLRQRNQRLTAHRVGPAREQHLDLIIVETRRVPAEIAAGLKVEVLQVIARVAAAIRRSEEHTSELQSLMRSSYAVL